MCETFFVTFGDVVARIEVIRNFDIFNVFPKNDSTLAVTELTKDYRHYDTRFMCYQIATNIEEQERMYSQMDAVKVWEQYMFHLLKCYYQNPPDNKGHDHGDDDGFDD